MYRRTQASRPSLYIVLIAAGLVGSCFPCEHRGALELVPSIFGREVGVNAPTGWLCQKFDALPLVPSVSEDSPNFRQGSFSFDGIESDRDANRLIDDLFPVGSQFSRMQAAMERTFKHTSRRRIDSGYCYDPDLDAGALYRDPCGAQLHHFTQFNRIEEGMTDAWFVFAFVNSANRITATEVVLLYDDDDPPRRRAPFRFENYRSKQLKGVLLNILGPEPSRDRVESFMSALNVSGMKKYKRSTESITYAYQKDYRDLQGAYIRLPTTHVTLSWTFTDDGDFVDLTVR